ncbi:Fur-regulated basic protein B [Bacillus thuringiensis serovar yunnanensis]|nr:Fur-regulated basic protein B [Bacillus thuringiensis serovar yunnanensis]
MRKKEWKNFKQLFIENKKELLNDRNLLNRIEEKVEKRIQSGCKTKS